MNDKLELHDKVAIILGGAMGIGGAVAKLLAKRGTKILIVDRAQKEGLENIQIINSTGGEAEFFKADVANMDECEAAGKKEIDM